MNYKVLTNTSFELIHYMTMPKIFNYKNYKNAITAELKFHI